MLLLGFALAGDGLPSVHVAWKGDLGRLVLDPPPGEHLAPEAPASGWIEVDDRHLELAGTGASLDEGFGLSVPGKGRRVVQGELSLSLCEDGGTACRPVEVAFIGTLEGRKGDQYLAVTPPPEPVEETVDAGKLTATEAFALAEAEGKLVLLDFSAVWCPPCNQLMAEVLHDPDNAVDLEDYVVVEIDVDRPDSWEMKDRYAVGSYPTVIAARPDGTALDRIVGYPGEDAFLSWLVDATGVQPVDELLARTDRTPAESSALALRLAVDGRDDEALEVLAEAEDGEDFRIARLMVAPTADDVAWLAERAPERALDWVFHAPDELPSETDALVDDALAQALAKAEGFQAADLLYLQAVRADDDPRLYAAAAATLRSAMSGDPALDRPHYTFLAVLYERSGRPDLGLLVLQQAASLYPHEMTWYHAAAKLLLRQDDAAQALPYAIAASSLGYGDQRLVAAKTHADVLWALGQEEEALALVDRVLSEAAAPDADVNVRTHRYRDALQAWREEHTTTER